MDSPFEQWIRLGYAIRDCGDGAWGWSEKGKALLSPMERTILSDLKYGHEIPSYYKSSNFDKDGFILEDE